MTVDMEAVAARLADDPDVVFAYVFGSQATGATRPTSDLDIAVYLRPGADPFEGRLRIMGTLQTALKNDAVDVVILNSAPIALSGRILRTRRVLVDRDPYLRHRIESLTAREFFDFRFREHRLLEAMAAHG